MLRLLCLVISTLYSLAALASCPLNDGDIVYIKSQSTQSKLLKLTTNSDWTHVGMLFKRNGGWDVIEAVQPVQWTSIYSFVRRSKNFDFVIQRPKFSFDPKIVKAYSESKLGLNYDLIFAWDDSRWYCSELVWKAFTEVSSLKLGELQRIGELQNIDSEIIKREAKKRFSSYGESYDHEAWKGELVITPIQMMESENLQTVYTKKDLEKLVDCYKSNL